VATTRGFRDAKFFSAIWWRPVPGGTGRCPAAGGGSSSIFLFFFLSGHTPSSLQCTLQYQIVLIFVCFLSGPTPPPSSLQYALWYQAAPLFVFLFFGPPPPPSCILCSMKSYLFLCFSFPCYLVVPRRPAVLGGARRPAATAVVKNPPAADNSSEESSRGHNKRILRCPIFPLSGRIRGPAVLGSRGVQVSGARGWPPYPARRHLISHPPAPPLPGCEISWAP